MKSLRLKILHNGQCVLVHLHKVYYYIKQVFPLTVYTTQKIVPGPGAHK